MWTSAKMITLPVFHHSSPTISISETLYEMQVSVFLICKHVWHFYSDRTATQRCHSSLDSVQAGTRSS
jgi:hypothetical protein